MNLNIDMSSKPQKSTSWLVEIYSEEIPARMQKRAEIETEILLKKILDKASIEFSKIKCFISAQRLSFIIYDLAIEIPQIKQVKKGPKNNCKEETLQSFLKANSIKKEDLVQKNGYFFGNFVKEAQKTKDLLSFFLCDFLNHFSWPKSMVWHNEKTNKKTKPWVRPIRSILCLFNDEKILIDLPDFGIQTSNETFGNRFLNYKKIEIQNTQNYFEQLIEHKVLIDKDVRKVLVLNLLKQEAEKRNLVLNHDEALLDEVVGLVEFPILHVGQIDDDFMSLPDIVLTTSMKVHQKYFSFFDKNVSPESNQELKLAPFFGVITQCPTQSIIKGFEKVLRARLSDACFFYEKDLKKPLIDNKSELNRVVFQEKLGTIGQKIDRLLFVSSKLNKELCEDDLRQLILLSKNDLVSSMVKEFPELQGIMGSIYAKKQKEKIQVYESIREHYLPNQQSDPCANQPLARFLSVIDKVDTLVGFFGLLIFPTGSKDPYALRRLAISCVKTLVETNFSLSLLDLFSVSWISYQNQNINLQDPTQKLIDFFKERLSVYLKTQYPKDQKIIDAVLKNKKNKDFHLDILCKRIHIFSQLLNMEEGSILLTTSTRCCGFLKDKTIKKATFFELQYQELYSILNMMNFEKDKEMEYWIHLSEFSEKLSVFCDNVLILCEDQNLQKQHLTLLQLYQDKIEEFIDLNYL